MPRLEDFNSSREKVFLSTEKGRELGAPVLPGQAAHINFGSGRPARLNYVVGPRRLIGGSLVLDSWALNLDGRRG